MSKATGVALLAVLFLALQNECYAQKATEIYIPVGKSPGLSGKYTLLGKITEIDTATQTVTVTDSSGSYPVSLVPEAVIYLDRHTLKLPNVTGTFADCRPGLMVEVKFRENKRMKPVEWVKVELQP